MAIFIAVLICVLIFWRFRRKKKSSSFHTHNGVMFDFSRMPNSGFNRKKKEKE